MSCKATINEVLLRFGFIRPDVPVQDAAGTPPKPSKTTQSLQAHDKQYHPNGWKPGDKCRLRDSIFNVDDLGSPTTGQGQQQPQQSSQGQTTQAVQPNNQDFPTESEFETVIGLVNANPRLVPPMLKQALDDLPKKIFDLAENQEYLDDAIADLPDGEAKDSLLADQQDLEKERMKLRGEFLQTYRVLSSILGTKKPEALMRNPALKHDPSQFPTTLDTTPTVNSDGSVDISFDGTSYHFTPCANGSTGPVEGTITINGQPKQFILKLSNKAGTRHAVPPEALKNEQAASEMLRKAGLNAPDAVVFEKNGQVYRLAEKIEPSTGLDQTPITQDIQRQLREAYPLLDLMYSHDAFRNDNIRVDQNGKVWFVDNGSSFAFKGYGDKKSASNPNWKGFDFEQRNDAAGQPLQGNDGNGGQKMYPAHYGALYESQKKIQKYLGQMTTKDLLKEASRYNMTALVAGLPKESKCQALEDFAASLDKLSAKAAGTRKVKSSLKQQPAAATTQQPAQGQQQSQQVQQGLTHAQQQAIGKLYMPQGVGVALVGAGIDLSQWSNGGGTAQYPQHWYNDVIDSQNNQTAVNMMTKLQSSLPAGYSAALYDQSGINGICVVKTADKQKLMASSSGGWPNGGFQQWIDGGQAGTQQTTASQPAMTTVGSSNNSFQIPTAVAMTMTNNVGASGIGVGPSWATTNGSLYACATQYYTSSLADAIAQQAANQLSANSGYTVFTFGRGNGKTGVGIIQGGPAGIPKQWGATIFNPQQQSPSTGLNTTLTSGTTVPPALNSMMHNLNLQGIPNSVIDNNGNYRYSIGMIKGASNPRALQTLANNLPQGMSVTTHSNGNAYIINTADYQGYWSNYNHQIVQPQTQASGGSTASGSAASSAAQTSSSYRGGQSGSATTSRNATPSASQTTASKPAPAASKSSQQQPASKPASTQPSSSSSHSTSATSTPKFTYGSAGSLVKSGGFNDGNISTDISNLISSTGLQSVKGKMLLAPGTKLKTQGSIANNGDLYIGLPAGTKKSDLQAIANHLNNEYGQYGYSAYPMGGSWISIEPTKQNTMKAKQTATAPAASTPKPAQTPASTPATSQTPPSATTSTQSTKTATTNPGGTSTSQPASTTATASNQTTGQTSATPTAQTAVPPPPRKTLSQMIQQRLANATPQQQARFQSALNRANGNSGIPPQPQTPQGASQPPQTASQTSGQPTAPSGQQSQQTASTVLLTAPKSGNQPTPAQQKTIARFQQQIQNARTPTQKAAFQQALSRYFGAI